MSAFRVSSPSRENLGLKPSTRVIAQVSLAARRSEKPPWPVQRSMERGDWFLLSGTTHTIDFNIRCAGRFAGRKQFIRRGCIAKGTAETPCFPDWSYDFPAVAPCLRASARHTQAGGVQLQAIPLEKLIESARQRIGTDPLALLCDREDC